MGTIYLSKDGQVFGPFTRQQIEDMCLTGDITQYAWIWPEGATSWQPAYAPPPPPSAPGSADDEDRTQETFFDSTANTQAPRISAEAGTGTVMPSQIFRQPEAVRMATQTGIPTAATVPAGSDEAQEEPTMPGDRTITKPVETDSFEDNPSAMQTMTGDRTVQEIAAQSGVQIPEPSLQPSAHQEHAYGLQKPLDLTRFRVICHDERTIVGGRLARVGLANAVFVGPATRQMGGATFKRGSKVRINLVDASTGRSETVVAIVEGAVRRERTWEYGLKWQKAPQLLRVA